MPKFGPSIKSLLTNKDKLCELARAPLNEHCSTVLLKKLLEKIGDPDKFLIPCDFPRKAECLAFVDLGASINLMPLSVWYNLYLLDLSPTCMTLELANHLISHPIGVAEDVYVKVDSFHFSSDFIVVDFDADPRVPLILGRSFLKTERALINVFEGELTLYVGKEAITFNLDQTSRYSANYNEMTAKRVDVISMAYEEYSQEVLDFSNVIASGNPTPYYDLIVSTTSSTLTPFEDSDFHLEEVDAFLTIEDDPTSPEVDQSYLDPEGDILLLEAFLNDDPSLPSLTQGNYLPEVYEELKICKAKFDKSLIDEPPEVELKDLPPHLEYSFLEGDDKLPVIIAKDISVEEKTALIMVQKSHKPFQRESVVKTQSQVPRVSIVYCCCSGQVNTARPKAVINKRNWVNDVKASSCWVWKPVKPNRVSIILKRYDYDDVRGKSRKFSLLKKKDATAEKIALLVKTVRLLSVTVTLSNKVKILSKGTSSGSTTEGTGEKKGRTVSLNTEDIRKRKNDVKARTTLLLALLDEHQLRFNDLYNHLKVYESEVQKKSEPNSQNMAFISSAKNNSGKEDVNTASIPTTSTNVSPASVNIGAKITIQSTDMAGFDKSKVECFNCHKMGQFARERMAPRCQDRGRRDNYRQGSKVEEQTPKALMAIDGVGWDWIFMANEQEDYALVADEEATIKFALMAKTSVDSEVFDNSICSKTCKKITDSLNRIPEFADDTVTDYSRPSPAIERTSDDGQNRNSSETEASSSTILIAGFPPFLLN
nr:reverse transcriptase domain-containing protein [Tanacetum cinerariifolium]